MRAQCSNIWEGRGLKKTNKHETKSYFKFRLSFVLKGYPTFKQLITGEQYWSFLKEIVFTYFSQAVLSAQFIMLGSLPCSNKVEMERFSFYTETMEKKLPTYQDIHFLIHLELLHPVSQLRLPTLLRWLPTKLVSACTSELSFVG